jgi:hypothetical protein
MLFLIRKRCNGVGGCGVAHHVSHITESATLQNYINTEYPIISSIKIMAASLPQSKMDSQAFSLFPRFPIEIRLKIWEIYTMLHPRIVEVCLMPKFDRYEQRHPISPSTHPPRSPNPSST